MIQRSFSALLKDIFIYGIGDLFLKGSIFITMPILTRLFSPEEYGTWGVLNTIVGIMTMILILGADSAYSRYYFEYRSQSERQRLTSTCLIFLVIWTFLGVLVALLSVRQISLLVFQTSNHWHLLAIALPGIPIALLNLICSQALRNQFKARLYAVLNLVSGLVGILFTIIGVLFGGLSGILVGTVLSAVVMLPVRLFSIRQLLILTFSWQDLGFLLRYGVPLVPASIAYWVFQGSDRILLGRLSSLEQVGLFTVAATISGILYMLSGVFSTAWNPHAIYIHESEPDRAPVVFGQMLRYIIVCFGGLAVVLSVFAPELTGLLSDKRYVQAAAAVGPLTLAMVAQASIQVTASGISLQKKTHYIMVLSWLAAFANLALNIVLMPKWGMIAAAWSTAVAYLLLSVSYFTVSQRLWPIIYSKAKLGIAIALVGGYTVFSAHFPELGLAVGIMIKLCYCASFVILLFLSGVLSQQEWQYLIRFSFRNLTRRLN
ncbi:MAG: oligosaccharide flippase family protein [Cyanobacteria bacterium NC_groundwater_1444_Ag_S-0.65um_54_12]|nr:oligosaccharide flippase family protein [Cyanobacteria bacterium NC_groundwater_1444_Ag_S-0.65um_54_12]